MVWSKILFLIVKALPGTILRLFIRSKHVAQDFEVDLRSTAPIHVTFGSTVPSFSAWLRYTNKSPVPIQVDRVVFDVWVGQPVVEGAILRRVEVRPKQTLDNVVFESKLSEVQQAAIRARLQRGGRLDTPVTIYMDVYCVCKVGRFELRVVKEYPGTAVEGLPLNQVG